MSMPPRRTQAERRAESRAALLRSARELFAAKGYADVGTEEISRGAGLTRGAFYHQFADKQALFEEVVRAVAAEVVTQVGERMLDAGDPDPLAALRAGTDAWLDVCGDQGVQRILLVDAPKVLGWHRWREIGQQHGLGMVTRVLSAAMAVGAITRQPVEPLAHIIIAALDEAALYVAHADDPALARTEVRAVLQRIGDSLV